VSLASRGLRNISDKEERIEDPAELVQVRHQALRVILKGALVAIPLTILAYLIP
jgi:hypothetical protein